MNKYLLQILLAVVLVGCSRNDEWNSGEVTEGGDIQFNISVPDASTRAAIINSRTELDGKSVGLYAFMVNADDNTKDMRAANVKLTYNKAADTWEYSDPSEPLKWDFEHTYDRFSFYVYYPFDENATNVNFDMETAAFSVDYDAVADKDVDVMIAELENITYPQGGVITLDLKHVLSAIAFNTDYSKPIADVKFCSGASYTTMPKSGTASLVGGTVQWDNVQNYPAEELPYSYSLGNQAGNYALIIPQTITNKGDLYFSMSYSDGVTAVDNGAQAPAGMEFKAGQIYTFKYKGSFAEVGDDGELVIDLAEYQEWCKDYAWNDYSFVDEIIKDVVKSANETGAEVKLTVKSQVKTADEAYHLLQHIVNSDLLEENPVIHIDFSDMILPTGQKLPDGLFKEDRVKNALKTLKLPPLVANDQFPVSAMAGCVALETLEFAEGSTITELPYQMCKGCTSLKNVNLETLTELLMIPQSSFIDCTALETIVVPKSVLTIQQDAFNGCTSLKNIIFEENSNLNSIGQDVFKNCSSIEDILLPAKLTDLHATSFVGCSGLETVTFGENSIIETITTAFQGCAALEIVTIPKSVKTIENNAFQGCTNLSEVIFEANSVLESISTAFQGCAALEIVTIPKSVKTIKENAFNGCSSLKDLTFEANSQLSTIEQNAFLNCSGLVNVILPKSLTVLGANAFNKCSNLETVEFETPSSLTTITQQAFEFCSKLNSINIPSSNITIGWHAFNGCTALTNAGVDFQGGINPDWKWNSFAGSGVDTSGF